MDYLLLIVAVIITLIMAGFYMMWLSRWYLRLAAFFGWILFIGGFLGLAATSYGFIEADENLWLIPLAIGAVLSVGAHILNVRAVARMIAESESAGSA